MSQPRRPSVCDRATCLLDRTEQDAPQSPSHVWMAEPTSIDEPLLLLDEEAEGSETDSATVARLRQELAEIRAISKADHAKMEDLITQTEQAQKEREGLAAQCGQLSQENTMLRTQLHSHHGIMAAEWGQTLGFQERLRQEEAACERFAEEVKELREGIQARAEEEQELRQDAAYWRLLSGVSSIQDTQSSDLDSLLQAALP